MGESERDSKPTSGERQNMQRKVLTPFRGLWLFWENQPCFGYVKRWRGKRGIGKEGWGCRSFFMQRRRLRQEGGEEARTSLDRLQMQSICCRQPMCNFG